MPNEKISTPLEKLIVQLGGSVVQGVFDSIESVDKMESRIENATRADFKRMEDIQAKSLIASKSRFVG
jgi:ATP-dependent RNA circularization protein (DNA/RNA ligase family)